MKLKKIDLSGAKDFLFQKGERIGMAVCAALALLFLVIGFMKAGGSNVDYAKAFKKSTDQRNSWISVPAIDRPVPTPKVDKVWDDVDPEFAQVPWVLGGDLPDTKRQNPTILKIWEDDNHLQMDYRNAGYFCYELLPGDKVLGIDGAGPVGAAFVPPRPVGPARGGQGGAGGPPLAQGMKPGRFVVVSAVFPMRDQIEEYVQKLRYGSVADLMANPEDLPKALGLNVYRCEYKDGKPTEWVPLYRFDVSKDKLEVAKHLEDLYRECYIDEVNPSMLGEHLKPGMITPLPQLANEQFPKLRLKGITLQEAGAFGPQKQPKRMNPFPRKGGVAMPGVNRNPMNQAKDEPELQFTKLKISDLPDPLKEKFSGNIDYFEPSGIKPDENQGPGNPNRNQPPPRPPVPRGPFPGRKGPNNVPVEKIQLYDTVVRFVDCDVEPGKTYRYSFQMRMANPNYQKKDVQHQGLAEIKELVSPFAMTRTITIPAEYFYYAMPGDIQPNFPIPEGSDRHNTKPFIDPYTAYGNWTTTVQIHSWVGTFKGAGRPVVADWAIAERLLTRRGDPVGRDEVMTEVPVWNKNKETFEIQFSPPTKKNSRANTGLPIDYKWGNPPLLLADFEGGWKSNVKVGTGTSTVTIRWDESATDILVLTPEGKLVARNARTDFDDSPVSMERNKRVEDWQARLKSLRAGGGVNGMPNGK